MACDSSICVVCVRLALCMHTASSDVLCVHGKEETSAHAHVNLRGQPTRGHFQADVLAVSVVGHPRLSCHI